MLLLPANTPDANPVSPPSSNPPRLEKKKTAKSPNLVGLTSEVTSGMVSN